MIFIKPRYSFKGNTTVILGFKSRCELQSLFMDLLSSLPRGSREVEINNAKEM